MRNDPDGYNARVTAQIEESKKAENLPPGFKLPAKAGGAAAADDFTYGSDDEEDDDEEEEDQDEGGADASGLTPSENRIVGQVCEMGFDREAVVRAVLTSICCLFAHSLQVERTLCLSLTCSAGRCTVCTQIGVVEKLKERGKEISNDSVAEKMLDL